MTLSLDKWPIFSLLDEEFLESVRLGCVFGSSGNEAIVFTKDDDVFSLGSNCSGCLGVDNLSSLQPRQVDILSKKKVTSLSYGSGPHVLTLTESGDVYAWGHNGYCQLGNGSTNQGSVPALVMCSLTGKKVVQVACGSHHSMALAADGEIYAWGQNNCGQVGSGSTSNQPTPRKVTACIGHRRAVFIACGQTSSMAVLDNGDLLGWGYNGNGQLGLGNNVNMPNPCRVGGLQDVIITQVACGYAHTLALSDDGALYVWGANSYGQLGTGNKANITAPFRVGEDVGRFVEVASSHYNHLSAAMTQDGRVMMWGQCRGQSVTSPMATRFHSINDVFACFGSPAVTCGMLQIEYPKLTTIQSSLKQSFNDSSTGDVRFLVEGRTIYAHIAILKIRCEYFRTMFQSEWVESESDEVSITHSTYAVFLAFLQYIYTDQVNLCPEDAVGLMDLANCYCESQLKRVCERLIRQGITVDNALMLYAAAIKYDAKKLEEFCFRGQPPDRGHPDARLQESRRQRYQGLHIKGC